jgi:hypothetical protein
VRRLVLGALVACTALAATPGPAPAAVSPTAVKHVFVIVMENKDYDQTFGPDSAAPYLSKTLTAQGQLLTQYYGIGHVSLDNYIAMVSGQAPNPQTQSDCQVFTDFVPVGPPDANGQYVQPLGGCVFPAEVPTLMSQLDAKGLPWMGFMEDMGTPCRHPALNGPDNNQAPTAQSQYATRHNPFMYFHGVIDDAASCAAKVRDLNDLPAALASEATTPAFTFITPDLCHDGHDDPCDSNPAQKGGLAGEDEFLQQWVPQILASPAFKKDGLLVITYDEAEPQSDQSACCGEVPGPNSAMPGIGGPGGGRTGTVLVSPFVQPGSVNDTPYNHYSFLRSMEDIFGLEHLGFAAAAGLKAFGDDVYSVAGQSFSPPTTVAPQTGTRGALPPTGRGTAAASAAAVLVVAWLLVRRATTPTP